MRTPNLTFHLNTSVSGVVKGDGEVCCGSTQAEAEANDARGYLHRPARNPGGTLATVIARTAGAEVEHHLSARYFVDCTGDGVVADLAGCEWRMGTEARAEFDEPHAPESASRDTMGNSIHFKAKNLGRPVPFVPPSWAVQHEDPAYFYEQGRVPKTLDGGYWWLEIGVPWDTIHDAERIRHELTRHTLGVWDWIKNKDCRLREKAGTYALDWVGQVPGKRESRRIIGRVFMNENDVSALRHFGDEVAFGGWFIDLHTPGGLLAATSESASAEGYNPASTYAMKSYVGPYGIPLGVCMAKDVGNLFMAGRNVSVTHAALGTVRVMATTALLGQAVGTAAALAVENGIADAAFSGGQIAELQQRLLRDGCFLPHCENRDPLDLARSATARASSEAVLHRVGPEENGHHDGLTLWRDQMHDIGLGELTARRGQWIAVGGKGRIDTLGVCLSNPGAEVRRVEARMVRVDHIWDYRSAEAEVLHRTVLEVPPGAFQWVRWEVGIDAGPGGYVRLDLGEAPGLLWHPSPRIEPGHVSAFEAAGGRMRRYGSGVTMSFEVEPPRRCYQAAEVLSGVTRPHRAPNLWRSAPGEGLPQWLELAWDSEQTIRTVELTFAGHLVREYHAYGPLYRDPQCVRDYSLAAWIGGEWVPLITEKGNYQRHRRHRLGAPVRTGRLRLQVDATHGDPSAAVYEVRCYGA